MAPSTGCFCVLQPTRFLRPRDGHQVNVFVFMKQQSHILLCGHQNEILPKVNFFFNSKRKGRNNCEKRTSGLNFTGSRP